MKHHSYPVAVGRFEKPFTSVQQIVDDCRGGRLFKPGQRVVIKPNIVFWTRAVVFPKYGVITTSRVVHDVVALLCDYGIRDISILEGSVALDPAETAVQAAHAFETLGYRKLARRYGVKTHNVFERPFRRVDLGDGIRLRFCADILDCDRIVNLPVLKTHAQTVVSLGIKNLKGTIDIASRKTCHSADPGKDLHCHVARLADPMPPMLTLIDGIYSAERGPNVDGRMHRSNILVAAADVFAADKVGARLLGHPPPQVPHLAYYAANHNRPSDLSDVQVVGAAIDDLARYHEAAFPYTENGEMPAFWARKGIEGLAYRQYDLTMCTYCSGLTGVVMTAIMAAWEGRPWDDVEVLSGKVMQADPTKKHTILLGKCMCRANRDNPNIRHRIPINGCPPKKDQIIKALHAAGIDIDDNIILHLEQLPGLLMKRYARRPEFEPGHFEVKDGP